MAQRHGRTRGHGLLGERVGVSPMLQGSQLSLSHEHHPCSSRHALAAPSDQPLAGLPSSGLSASIPFPSHQPDRSHQHGHLTMSLPTHSQILSTSTDLQDHNQIHQPAPTYFSLLICSRLQVCCVPATVGYSTCHSHAPHSQLPGLCSGCALCLECHPSCYPTVIFQSPSLGHPVQPMQCSPH